MQTFIEPIRFTISAFGLVTVFAILFTVRSPQRLLIPWALLASAAALFFTHVTHGFPLPQFVPAIALVGLAVGIAGGLNPAVRARFDALTDGQWRTLMSLRAVFGALLLASGAAGLMPAAFALPAGLGDLLVGALALAVPGNLAAKGHRGARLLVFGVGIADFVQVIALQVLVLVPWLVASRSEGISLVLPWVVVPSMVALNLHGLRSVLAELFASPRLVKA